MKTITFKNGLSVPAIGQGTWRIGDIPQNRTSEIEAIRAGIDSGMTLIDTAEMYGDGNSELLVGEAIRPYVRKQLFLVSKVLPHNAGRHSMCRSCEDSLKRLGTDYLDLYLYHWRGSIPLSETVACLEDLKRDGLILEWGVSNFDVSDMDELFQVPNGTNCLVNQVLYHAASRGIEYSLLPWMTEHHITLMSYCPLAQAGRLRSGLIQHPVLQEIAKRHQASAEQVLLAWNIRNDNTIAIPKSGSKEHTFANAYSSDITLDEEDLRLIDQAFPAPDHKIPLDVE